MTSTNDGKDVKSNQTSGQKGKSYYIEVYKTLDAALSGDCELQTRTRHVCDAWRCIHSLCQHAAHSTHAHLLGWLQRHTARTLLQTEWQLPKNKDECHKPLEEAIGAFIEQSRAATVDRGGISPQWESQLVLRAEWFQRILPSPWGHPVLRVLLDAKAEQPTDNEVLEWLKHERSLLFVTRLRQLAADKMCVDLALLLVAAVMDRVRHGHKDQADDISEKPKAQSGESTFADVLRTEAGFTLDVFELLTDMEFILLHKKNQRARCIELAKQTPLRDGYTLVERLQSRLEASPRDKKLWKNAKEVATLIAQVIITRCMVVPICSGAAYSALFGCTRSLARLLTVCRLPAAAAALAAPAATARHLHTLAVAVDKESTAEMKPFVCELYVRAITAGMNELERLKLKTEKEAEAEARQTLAAWFTALGAQLAPSQRMRCECALTAFSLHPAPHMYTAIRHAPALPAIDIQEPKQEQTTSEFGSWANDSRSQTNFVKTSETLNLKQQSQHQANVLSVAILTEGEALGLSPELCQDISVLLSGPRLKTLSWDMDRERLLENCRTYMEKTGGGTRAVTTELKYLNLDPRQFEHLPVEEEDESDMYYGIEKGYEHLVEEYQEPEEIWQDADDPERTESARSSDVESSTTRIRRKKKSKRIPIDSDEDLDPLSSVADAKRIEKKKERPHSKERSKERPKPKPKPPKDPLEVDCKKEVIDSDITKDCQNANDAKEDVSKEKKKRQKKKKEKPLLSEPKKTSLSKLIGMKISKSCDSGDYKLNTSITDSDYDSQGKSSINSLNLEANESEVLFDGLFSMDEIKSPEKKISDKLGLMRNNELYLANGSATINLQPKKCNNTDSSSQDHMTPAQINFMNSTFKEDRKVVAEDVKKSITKLIQFRRQKAINEQKSIVTSQPITPALNTHPNVVRMPNAINNPQVSLHNQTSPKAVAVPDIPKVFINKKQSEQLNDIKNEVNCLLNNQKYVSSKPVIQYAHGTNTIAEQSPSKQLDPIIQKRPENRCLVQNNLHHKSLNRSNELIKRQTKGASLNEETAHAKSFHDFLHELQKSINAGAAVDPPRQKSRKDIRPMSRVTPISVVKTEPKMSQCAKPIPQKKSENAPNTFSRLSYMHKNNKSDLKVKQAEDQAAKNQLALSQIDQTIEEQKIAKLRHMQSSNLVMSRVGKPKSYDSNQPNKLVDKPTSSSTSYVDNYPVISGLLISNKMSKLKGPKDSVTHDNQFNNVPDRPCDSTAYVPNRATSLSEKDQNDLLLLLRQQRKQNATHPKYENTGYIAIPHAQSPSVNTHANQYSSASFYESTSNQSIRSYVSNTPHIKTPITSIPQDVHSSSDAKSMDIPINMVKTELNYTKKADSLPTKSNKTEVLSETDAKHDKNSVVEQEDWERVMNDLLSHKTPSRGPNALEMALNKDCFHKSYVDSILRTQRMVMPSMTVDSAKSSVIKESPKGASKSMTNAVVGSVAHTSHHIQTIRKSNTSKETKRKTNSKQSQSSSIKVPPNVEVRYNTSVLRPVQNETPKKQADNKRLSQTYIPKNPASSQKKQFVTTMPKADPFISGIPNSDYDLLEELMDDDLRQEIGELSDDDSYNAQVPNQKDPKNFTVIKSNLKPEDGRVNTASTSANRQQVIKPPVRTTKSKVLNCTDDKPISSRQPSTFLNTPKVITEYIHENPPPPKDDRLLTTNMTQHTDNNMTYPTDTTSFVATIPQPTALQNVVLIGTDIVYRPCTVQTQIPITNIVPNTYVTYNQPNMTLYQTTQFAAPVVNPLIIGSAITTTSSLPVEPVTGITNIPPINATKTSEVYNHQEQVMKKEHQTETMTRKDTLISNSHASNKEVRYENALHTDKAYQPDTMNKNYTLISNSHVSNQEVGYNIVQFKSYQSHEDAFKTANEFFDSNSNKNCERKVLSEVQERFTVSDNVETKITRNQKGSFDHDDKKEVLIEQDRLKKKRMAILNRNIYHRCYNQPIPLMYTPLEILIPKRDNGDEKHNNERVVVNGDCQNDINTGVNKEALINKNTLPESKQDNAIVSATVDSPENCKENKTEPTSCRRILLRSSNRLSKVKTADVAPSYAQSAKVKVKLKFNATKHTEKLEDKCKDSDKDSPYQDVKLNKEPLKKKNRNKNVCKEKKKSVAKLVKSVENQNIGLTEVKSSLGNNKESIRSSAEIPLLQTSEVMDIEEQLLGSKILKKESSPVRDKSAVLNNIEHKLDAVNVIIPPVQDTSAVNDFKSLEKQEIRNNVSIEENKVNIDKSSKSAKVIEEILKNKELTVRKTQSNHIAGEKEQTKNQNKQIPSNSLNASDDDVNKIRNKEMYIQLMNQNKDTSLDVDATRVHKTTYDTKQIKVIPANNSTAPNVDINTVRTTEKDTQSKEESNATPSKELIPPSKEANTVVNRACDTKGDAQSMKQNKKNLVNNSSSLDMGVNNGHNKQEDVQSTKQYKETPKNILTQTNVGVRRSVEGEGKTSSTTVKHNVDGSITNPYIFNHPQKTKLLDSRIVECRDNNDDVAENKTDLNSIPQSYKDSIIFEDMPHVYSDPLKKCVRIKLPSGKVFKATVHGKVPVNFDTFFSDPTIKDVLLSNLTDRRRYTLNIKQVSTTSKLVNDKIVETRIQEVKLLTPVRPSTMETINLLSDDENDDPHQYFNTEYGKFKVNLNKDDFTKHQKQFDRKCFVKLKRLPRQQNMQDVNIEPNHAATKSEVNHIDEDIIHQKVSTVDKSPSFITAIPEVEASKKRRLSTLYNENKNLGAKEPLVDETNIIEIDDSSNDSVELNQSNSKANSSKNEISELTNRLLNDLGISDLVNNTDSSEKLAQVCDETSPIIPNKGEAPLVVTDESSSKDIRLGELANHLMCNETLTPGFDDIILPYHGHPQCNVTSEKYLSLEDRIHGLYPTEKSTPSPDNIREVSSDPIVPNENASHLENNLSSDSASDVLIDTTGDTTAMPRSCVPPIRLNNCYVKVTNCDDLVKKYDRKLIKQKCFVKLFRIDEKDALNCTESDTNISEKSDDKFEEIDENISQLSRSDSFSILNDFSTSEIELPAAKDDERCSSPVIKVYETIAALNIIAAKTRENLRDSNVNTCTSEWRMCKSEIHLLNKTLATESYTIKVDSNTSDFSDKLSILSKPKASTLIAIVSKFFQDNVHILNDLKPLTSVLKSASFRLKRKLPVLDNSQVESKISKLENAVKYSQNTLLEPIHIVCQTNICSSINGINNEIKQNICKKEKTKLFTSNEAIVINSETRKRKESEDIECYNIHEASNNEQNHDNHVDSNAVVENNQNHEAYLGDTNKIEHDNISNQNNDKENKNSNMVDIGVDSTTDVQSINAVNNEPQNITNVNIVNKNNEIMEITSCCLENESEIELEQSTASDKSTMEEVKSVVDFFSVDNTNMEDIKLQQDKINMDIELDSNKQTEFNTRCIENQNVLKDQSSSQNDMIMGFGNEYCVNKVKNNQPSTEDINTDHGQLLDEHALNKIIEQNENSICCLGSRNELKESSTLHQNNMIHDKIYVNMDNIEKDSEPYNVEVNINKLEECLVPHPHNTEISNAIETEDDNRKELCKTTTLQQNNLEGIENIMCVQSEKIYEDSAVNGVQNDDLNNMLERGSVSVSDAEKVNIELTCMKACALDDKILLEQNGTLDIQEELVVNIRPDYCEDVNHSNCAQNTHCEVETPEIKTCSDKDDAKDFCKEVQHNLNDVSICKNKSEVQEIPATKVHSLTGDIISLLSSKTNETAHNGTEITVNTSSVDNEIDSNVKCNSEQQSTDVKHDTEDVTIKENVVSTSVNIEITTNDAHDSTLNIEPQQIQDHDYTNYDKSCRIKEIPDECDSNLNFENLSELDINDKICTTSETTEDVLVDPYTDEIFCDPAFDHLQQLGMNSDVVKLVNENVEKVDEYVQEEQEQLVQITQPNSINFIEENKNSEIKDNSETLLPESCEAESTELLQSPISDTALVNAKIKSTDHSDAVKSFLDKDTRLILSGNSDSDIVLTGIEYEDPEIGTYYVFTNISETSELESDAEKITEIIDEEASDDEFKLKIPKITYSKQHTKADIDFQALFSEKKGKRNLKRKTDMTDVKTVEKKYRKGKGIDYPKITLAAMEGTAYTKQFKRLFEYFNSIKFSYSIPFHKENINVHKMLCDWPINVSCSNETGGESEKHVNLFMDGENDGERVFPDPKEQTTLVEEIVAEYKDNYPTSEINETNFNMGFGEGSDRVIQNLGDDFSKFSAATLSDVKQSQPLLLSKSAKNSYNTCKYENEKLQRHYTCIHLKDKVRSFFRKTRDELRCDWLKDNEKDYDYYDTTNFPFGLTFPEFIEPYPVETIVQVVQVGQLPVSAAAQNPVTCDPRVTQVSDVSPSQCSVENSPNDDPQSAIKTEYTELTTADLSLPMVQDYAQHNQSMTLASQEASSMPGSNENSPIETEIKSVVKIELIEELPEIKKELNENGDNNDSQILSNNNLHNIDYSFANASMDINSDSSPDNNTNIDAMFESAEKQQITEAFPQQKQQNGSSEKTDQIAHAMNAAGITTTAETITNNRAHALVNILSQKIRQGAIGSASSGANSYPKTTSINAMALQQALAQILPPSLNHTNVNDNNQQASNSSGTQQVLHIVQSKNAAGNQITLVDNTQQSVINGPNTTPVLHIVQNKGNAGAPTSNGTPSSQTNTFSGLSLVDAGLQQGGNQLLHIVNTGNQKNANAGQLLKRVNLLTNLTNIQGSNEQKMVQFVCKSADGKAIQLNAPHQRGMVLRLQPVESPNIQAAQPKLIDAQEMSSTPNAANTVSNKETVQSQQEIKSRSVYEENYAKFIQNSSSNKTTLPEKSTSLPKFNQAFGKQGYQDGNQKQNDINTSNSHLTSVNNNNEATESQATDNAINLDHISQISSPPLLLRKSPAQTSQAQSNLVQQIKQTIAPMNLQTMHGGVIYTRQIPVNIGGGQTINLITVPSTELIDDSTQKQQTDMKFVNQGEMEPSIIKIVPQTQMTSNTDVSNEENNTHIGVSNENTHTPQPQPMLTQMRIKLPMLSKTPQMVSGARVVRPSFFQIQRNVIGGANQPVYQQLVLTAAPPLGQQTIRLPQTQTSRQVKVPTESQSSTESQMSSSTLEQLREFDLVLEQVKERSTVQPNANSGNSSFSKLHTSSSDTTDGSASSSSTSTESTQQVLYSIGNNQPFNVAYVNRKANVTTPTTSFVRSPDSSGIADSPTPTSHIQIPHTVTSDSSTSETPVQTKPTKVSSKSKSRPKASSNPPNTLKLNTTPPKTSTQKPLEDEQTTQRILYILAEYKEQVENSPDKDKPAPRRRSNPPSNPSGSSKRKKSSSSSRRSGGRDISPVHGEDTCRTMGSEDSSCGTSQGDCNESCLDSHSPQDSPRKVVRKLTFEQELPITQPRPQPQRNVIVADGQTITVARGTAGKPATAVLMPANYILPVSMVKGGQQIAIVTNRGPKLLTVGGGEGGATNALLLQRLIGPAGLKPVLARPGVRHVRLPTAALHNLQAFNLATATTVQPPDSTASPAPAPTPPELIETRATSSPWTDRVSQDVKPERGSSPEGSEPWNLPSSADRHDYSYEEAVRVDNMDRTVLIVHKKDGSSQRQHRLTHVSAAAMRHKYAILEHERRLQKSLSEECEDLGVDSPSASELFPEAELLFAASPAHDHTQDHGHHSHTPQPMLLNHSGIPQPDMDDQIATDQLLTRSDLHDDRSDLNLGLEDVGIVTVSEDGMQATIALDQEEFARAHPNTTFHSEPTDDGEVQPFTITGLKGRHITSTIFHSNRAPGTVLMTAPQTTVISQASAESSGVQNVKYADIDNMINCLPSSHTNSISLSSVLVKDDGLARFDNILNDSRELHLSNTASAIVHSTGNATQVIRRVCYDDDKRDTRFLMDEPDGLIAGDDAKMIVEDSSRDATLESMADVDDDRSSPERHTELFWESNSASERSESRRPLDFSSDSDKCCKSPSFDETNSTDSSGVGTHMRLDSVIKEARGIGRSGSADGSSADDTQPPLRTYPPKRVYHSVGDIERSMSGKTRAGERSPDSVEVRRRASGRGVVKRGCHCCNGSPAPPRPKKPRQRKPTLDFTSNN